MTNRQKHAIFKASQEGALYANRANGAMRLTMAASGLSENLQKQIIRAFKAPVAKIEELAAVNAKMVFDYEDPKGNKMARSHVYGLRGIKGDIERARKEAKESALVFGRAVDAQAKELESQVVEMIDIHQKPLDAIEQREKDRLAKVDATMNAVTVTAEQASQLELAQLNDLVTAVELVEIDDAIMAEMGPKARLERSKSLAVLADAITAKKKEIAERAELYRLRAEAEKAKREDEIRQAAEAAAERERQAAERRAADEATRVERERKAAEDRQRAEIERVKAEAEAAARKAEADAAAAIARIRQEEAAKAAAVERAKAEELARAERERAAADVVAPTLTRSDWRAIYSGLRRAGEYILAEKLSEAVKTAGGGA